MPASFLADRLQHRPAAQERLLQGLRAGRKALADDAGLSLVGNLAGTWASVDGYLTFPYTFPDAPELGQFEILVRGFEVQAGADGEYRVDGWDRLAYWIRFDVADPADIPRLVPAVELLEGFDPATNTDYPELAADASVQATCGVETCSVQWIPYVELQEEGRDYSAYPDGAAQASLVFVSDAAGDALAAVLDIYDQDGNFERTDSLYVGDSLKLYTNAYRMSEPDARYLVEYVGFQVLDTGFQIERGHYVPDADYLDPDLPDELDAANRPLRFLLDAQRDDGMGGTEFAYGGPFPLGMDWGEAPDYLFGSAFEPVQATAQAPLRAKASLVKPRPRKD